MVLADGGAVYFGTHPVADQRLAIAVSGSAAGGAAPSNSESATVVVRVALEPSSPAAAPASVSASCVLRSANAWRCVVTQRLPGAWFHKEGRRAVVTVGDAAGALRAPGPGLPVSLYPEPRAQSALPPQHLAVQLPLRSVFPGEEFEVKVSALTVKLLTTVALEFTVDKAAFEIVDITHNVKAAPPWQKPSASFDLRECVKAP